jgi:hypothetical protein
MVSRYSRASIAHAWEETATFRCEQPIAPNRLSVLQNARKHHIRAKPFPHIVLDDALPKDLYETLLDSFPSPDDLCIVQSANNKRWDFGYSKSKRNFRIPRLWRDFLAYHSSQDFFHEVATLFFEEIHELYPDRYPTREALTRMVTGVRDIDSLKDKDILLEALISGNTPVTEACSVRTTHLDMGDKLFVGLFYMRPTDYDAIGGDLTISRFKPQYAGQDRRSFFDARNQVDDHLVETVETIQYAKNRLVLFINSPDSLHGVTVRQQTRHSRLFVNLVSKVNPPLFFVRQKRQKQTTRASRSPYAFWASLSSRLTHRL